MLQALAAGLGSAQLSGRAAAARLTAVAIDGLRSVPVPPGGGVAVAEPRRKASALLSRCLSGLAASSSGTAAAGPSASVHVGLQDYTRADP